MDQSETGRYSEYSCGKKSGELNESWILQLYMQKNRTENDCLKKAATIQQKTGSRLLKKSRLPVFDSVANQNKKGAILSALNAEQIMPDGESSQSVLFVTQTLEQPAVTRYDPAQGDLSSSVSGQASLITFMTRLPHTALSVDFARNERYFACSLPV